MKQIIMLFVESILFAFKALKANLLRTILSLLGVAVGIFCIISVLSLIDSLEIGIKKSFDMIGDDLIFVMKWPAGPEEGDEEYAWWEYISRKRPRLKDQKELKNRLTLAQAVAFQSAEIKTAEYRNSFMNSTFLTGVSFDYQDVIRLDLESGRYFSQAECEAGRNVCVIGFNVADALFGDIDPIGKSIKVGGRKIDVIGVLEKEGNSLLQNGIDPTVLVPVDFASRLFRVDESSSQIIIKAMDGVTNEELKNEVISTLRPIRGLKPNQRNVFSLIEATMISGLIDSVFGITNRIGFFIGFFAILVGAFGIVNIMFVSVRERTPLIGIQKSLGARNGFILNQFLFESVFLCVIGGVIGLALIYPVAAIVSAVFGFEVNLSLFNILVGVGMSAIIGVIAGIVPAWMASQLDPVDAMRS
jgi:putative ABC transport system permease protein